LDSTCPMPYALSWYLDVVSPGWEAVVLGNYEAVMPLTFKVKYGVSYIFTPPFVQQLGIFSNKKANEEAFIKAIPAKFKYIDVNLNEGNTTAGVANTNILLSLNNSYQNLYAAFTDNTKRNIKKAEKAGLAIKELSNAAEVINLFKANKGKEVGFGKAEYDLLNTLVKTARQHSACSVWCIVNPNKEVVAGAVFLSAMGRHIFLFSGNNADARQAGAMHFLLAGFIKKHAGTNSLLDFEGSNNANLARFYLSFGGYKTQYPKLKLNRLPFPLNKLKA
jgi:hypothetical protein